jgi:streptogramin lyase
VNEVSTIAAAYAFAGFASDATHVSSSNTALAKVGIKNAFANATNLASLATGAALATPANGSGLVPQDEIYALADILASCINSNGVITSPSRCYTLLNNAQSAGSSGTVPADTATAAINIAHNPGSNVAALFGLASANPPFANSFAQPNDFTIAVQFTGGGVTDPNAVAIDGSGNVWTTNNNSTVSQLSSLGSAVSGSPYSVGGLNGPNGIAIDTAGNAWIANYSGNSVTELTSSGAAVSGSPFSGGNMSGPYGIAIDGTTGYVWVTNSLSPFSVTKLSSAGAVLSGSNGYTNGGLATPYSVAIDHAGDAWVANNTNSSVTEYSNAGALLSSTGYVGGGVNRPRSIAIDASGNAWIADNANLSSLVTELKNDGTAISTSSGFTGGGLNNPYAIAIDGAGNAWVGNNGSNSVSELASATGAAISPANTGYVLPNSLKCVGIALDGSGDVWIADPNAQSVTELIGAATPVVTPLSVGAMNNTLGTQP